jgi:hypothetical protein
MTYPDNTFPDFPKKFWDLVILAGQDFPQYVEALKSMEKKELIDFYWTFESAASEFKGNPYVEFMSEQLSEDGVDDVAQWVVSQGRDHYWQVVNDPQKIPVRVDRAPNLLGRAVMVYYDRFNESIPDPEEEE